MDGGRFPIAAAERLLFFYVSKVFWLFFQPTRILFVLMLLGFLLTWRGRRRAGLLIGGGAALVFGLAVYTTLGALMLTPLENRFSRPDPAPAHVDGIIVMGGFSEPNLERARREIELDDAADRIIEGMRLARTYPDAKLVVTGGSGSLTGKSKPEAEKARDLLAALGFSGPRFLFETKARNTVENAVFTKELVQPKPGEVWLLVTSAFHMPRSVGSFRAIDFPVTPWPVDYRSHLPERFGLSMDTRDEALMRFGVAVREWIGLIAYRLTGKTDALLPSP